jgi:glutamate 5-kinase
MNPMLEQRGSTLAQRQVMEDVVLSESRSVLQGACCAAVAFKEATFDVVCVSSMRGLSVLAALDARTTCGDLQALAAGGQARAVVDIVNARLDALVRFPSDAVRLDSCNCRM